MNKKGKSVNKNYMTLEFAFTGIRIIDGHLAPVDWLLQINMAAFVGRGKSREHVELAANVAYQKIYYWLETNCHDIIVVDVSNEKDLLIANLTANIMMYCPEAPSDITIAQLIHAKLTALSTDDMVIGEIKIKGSDTPLTYTVDIADGNYTLPETTEEYYAEGNAKDMYPWWHRDDGFCFEFVRPAGTTLSDEELFKDIVDPMVDFKHHVSEVLTEQPAIVREPAKIVQMEKWKPTRV